MMPRRRWFYFPIGRYVAHDKRANEFCLTINYTMSALWGPSPSLCMKKWKGILSLSFRRFAAINNNIPGKKRYPADKRGNCCLLRFLLLFVFLLCYISVFFFFLFEDCLVLYWGLCFVSERGDCVSWMSVACNSNLIHLGFQFDLLFYFVYGQKMENG